MKSRWHRGQGDDQHAPVEMRFIDMFMTAIGSLVFIAMLLVFLLPKTTQSTTAKDMEIDGLKAQIQLLKRTEDKQIVLRRFGVMLVTDGECTEQPGLYVRWEGTTEDFGTGNPTGEAMKFDVGNPANRAEMVGQNYFNVGRILQPIIKKRLFAEIFLTTVRSPGTYSVYTGLKHSNNQKGKGCTIFPFYLSPEGITSGDELVLTQQRPYAWLRRFTVDVDGRTTLKIKPNEDDNFKHDLETFSKEQSDKLCERTKICRTEDAHYALLFPARSGANRAANNTKFIGTASVSKTQINVRSAPNPNDKHNIIGKLNRGKVINVLRRMDDGWDEIETNCDDAEKLCHGFVNDSNLTDFNVRTPGQ